MGTIPRRRFAVLLAYLPILGACSCETGDSVEWKEQDRFFDAAEKGDLRQIRRMIADGFDVNERNLAGEVALHEAARLGHVLVIDVLLEAGAEIDAASKTSTTPIGLAIANNQLHAVRHLLKQGASINGTVCNGKSALETAQMNDREEMISLIKRELAGQEAVPCLSISALSHCSAVEL